MANIISGLNIGVAGYPQPWGTKIKHLVDHYGPTSYSNVGTSSGTGDVMNAADFGEGGIEAASTEFSGYSQSGNYIVKATIPSANSLALGSAQGKVTLTWWTTSAAFGAISTEVSNATSLVAEVVRVSLTMV
jgi:hypothetical protein